MKSSLNSGELVNYVVRQLNTFFDDGRLVQHDLIHQHIGHVLERVEYCFSRVNSKYFFDGSSVLFNHLHGDQYCMFLYFLSNTLFRKSVDPSVCSKIFLLNKALHGIDAYYEVSLPDIFLVVHPVATVLGRGAYSDYFIAYQRCGIGSNHDIYPEIGKYVTLHPGSSVLGKSRIGENCKIAAESLVLDTTVPPDTLYIGNPKQHILKTDSQSSNFWRK